MFLSVHFILVTSVYFYCFSVFRSFWVPEHRPKFNVEPLYGLITCQDKGHPRTCLRLQRRWRQNWSVFSKSLNV